MIPHQIGDLVISSHDRPTTIWQVIESTPTRTVAEKIPEHLAPGEEYHRAAYPPDHFIPLKKEQN